MQDNPIGLATPGAEDAATERAVLSDLLTLENPLTLDELVRHMAAFHSSRDCVERALRELSGAGLLNKTSDEYVLPTRAARKLADLAEFP